MIAIDKLCRNFGKTIAVDNVSFKVELREIVGLLGHNGAGKSTLMKMLTASLEPSDGSISINGIDLRQDRQRAQSQIGYLPENSPLYPEMTVLAYLEYAAALKAIPESKRRERIAYALYKTRIIDVAEKKIATLSRGYKQRLGVAQAILNSPSILILDEPTNGLDPSQISEMRSLVTELAEHAMVIISTHILQEVEAICQRVLIINKGKLALDSKLDKLRSSPGISITIGRDGEAKSFPELFAAARFKVLECTQMGERFNYSLEAESEDEHLVPALVEKLVQEHCKIYAVHPLSKDLEAVFREISHGKSIPVEALSN